MIEEEEEEAHDGRCRHDGEELERWDCVGL